MQRLLAARTAEEQANHRVPSLAAGLARRGALVWSGGRGRIHGANGPVPDADVQYRAGSITKTFVAAAVLRLRDEGRLDLSDPVGQYFDAADVSHLTIGQLLSQTSGLRAETSGPWWERTEGAPFESLTQASLGPDARRHRPGRQYHYSNVGYALLGHLVSTVRNKPWFDVVAEELLAPLGMTRTTTRPQTPHATGFAVHPHADLLLPEPEHDAMAMAPAGQLWTTVADLARWAGFLAGQGGLGGADGRADLLSAASLAEMREPIGIDDTADQPWAQGYGLGLQLWNENGRRSHGHTGSMPGFVGILKIDTASGDAAVALCNSTSGFGVSAFASDLLHILAENDPQIRPEWVATTVADDVLGLVGTWYWGPSAFLVSMVGATDGGELEFRMGRSGERAFRFRRNGDGRWIGLDGYFAGEVLRPVPGADGQIVALDLASHNYTRTPYDPAAPVPGGLHPSGWGPTGRSA